MNIKEKTLAQFNAVAALSEAIRELQQVPSGHLYARVMAYMSIEFFESAITMLCRTGLVKNENHLLTWVGPK